MRRALLSGDLAAHLVKDGASQPLPSWAWENGSAAENAFNFDWLPLNPLLRHGMQEFAEWRCFVSRTDFKAWVAGSEVGKIGNLPALPAPVGYKARPDLLSYREPPDRPFIELTHALTWIAFAISLSREELSFMEPFQFGPFAKSGWTEALRAGMAGLADQASAGNIRVRGRYVANYSDRSAAAKVDTAYLPDTQLRDFACFDSLHGGLMHGAGLASDLDWFSHVFDGRGDGWHDVEVCRTDLIKAFPHRTRITSEGNQSVAPPPLSYNEPAAIAPWWSVSEALAWVATQQPDFVAFIGNRVRRESEIGTLLSHFMFEQDVAAVQSHSLVAEFWPGASTLAQAGRALLAQILSGAVRPRTRGAIVAVEIFVGTGLDPTGADWLDLDPQPLFSSEELIRAFSASGLDPVGNGGEIVPDSRQVNRVNKPRKKPGPAPDPDWPGAIAMVTRECIAAGYKQPGKRGHKAAIQTMLLNYMADKNKHFSPDAAAKHAEKVIAALPDN